MALKFEQIWQSSVVRLSFSSSIIRASGLGVTLLTSVVLARLLGPAGLGYYSFALAVVTIAGLPLHAGLSTLVMRETAKEGAASNWSKMIDLWRWSGRTIIILSVAILSTAIAGLLLLGDRITPAGGLDTVLVSLCLIPLIAVAQAGGGAIRGLQRPVLGLLPDSVFRPFSLLLLLAISWVGGIDISALTAMEAHVVCAFIAALAGLIMLRWVKPNAVHSASPNTSAEPRWKKALVPLALLAGTQIVFQNTNLVMLGFWHSPEDLGLFKVAISAANLVLLGLTAINMIMAPTFVKFYTLKDITGLQRKAALSALLGFGAALVCASILILFGKSILAVLFGSAFILAYIPLLILISGQLCSAWFGCAANLLNMAGHEITSLKVTAAVFAVNIVLNAILIPAYGIAGAAASTALSTAAWSVALGFVVRDKLEITATPLGLIGVGHRDSTAQSEIAKGKQP